MSTKKAAKAVGTALKALAYGIPGVVTKGVNLLEGAGYEVETFGGIAADIGANTRAGKSVRLPYFFIGDEPAPGKPWPKHRCGGLQFVKTHLPSIETPPKPSLKAKAEDAKAKPDNGPQPSRISDETAAEIIKAIDGPGVEWKTESERLAGIIARKETDLTALHEHSAQVEAKLVLTEKKHGAACKRANKYRKQRDEARSDADEATKAHGEISKRAAQFRALADEREQRADSLAREQDKSQVGVARIISRLEVASELLDLYASHPAQEDVTREVESALAIAKRLPHQFNMTVKAEEKK